MNLVRSFGVDSFDLILANMSMPVMGALEMARSVRELPCLKRIPIVVLIRPLEDEKPESKIGNAIDAFVTKPYAPGKLLDLFSKLI